MCGSSNTSGGCWFCAFGWGTGGRIGERWVGNPDIPCCRMAELACYICTTHYKFINLHLCFENIL